MNKIKETLTEPNYAQEQAKSQLESIVELVEALEKATGPDERGDGEEERESIQDDPLSVQIRSGWVSPGDKMQAEEFEIVLCTGGPAVRIIGELDEFNQPKRAWMQYQDWGTQWSDYVKSMIGDNQDKLMTYCQQFYFGE